MKVNKKLCSVALASTAIVLFLILIFSTTSAATAQSTSNTAGYAYITNSGSTTVSAIDITTNKVTATINVGRYPYGVAVNPAGTKVYVSKDKSGAISVIDTAKNKVTATVKVGKNPWGVAINPEGTRVYVANEGSKTVSVINTETNKVTATVKVGNYPCGVAVNTAGTKVYVTNTLDNTVSVIDTATNKVTATIKVGNLPTGVAVNPAGTKVYVANEYDVSVIDTAKNKVTARVKVGKYPWGVAVNPAGTKVYVTNYGDGTFSVINAATNKVTATVKVGNYPLGVAFSPDGTKAYVAKETSGAVSVVNTATNMVITTVKVGKEPAAFGKFTGSVKVQKPKTPVAVFYASPKSGRAPLSVKFTDKSTGTPTKWKWDFGDGSKSFLQNPTHKYSKAGKYTVTLKVTNAAGIDTATKSKYIIVTAKPAAVFYASPKSGTAPLSVKFTDKSTGKPTKWKWSFGDGKTSTEKNPTHKYYKIGKYTVKLTVTNEAGSNTATKSKYITVKTSQAPVAVFYASPKSGTAPLSVKFTDKSTGKPTKWKWSFGDGKTSTEKSPTHKYSKTGKYTVKLTVTNAAGSNTATKSKYITVKTSQAPVAVFYASPKSGTAPLSVKFTDKSTGKPTKWKWSFGDGKTSTEKSPTHTYSKEGKYTVKLTVTNAAGSNTATKSKYIMVTETSQAPTADFWGWPLSGDAPLKVTFTETSKGSPTSWKWDFGDGKYSTEKSPTHTYSAAGTYTVKLTATNAAGSSTKTKWNYIKVSGTSQAPTADFWGWPLSGKAPLKVKFTETSKGSPTSWKWNFGDGKYSTEKSPTHTYSAAGTYTVKLTATNAAGSSTKSKWNYIKVTK
ncbi:glutaminyl-peptide cyclotransferase [Methanosarcina barkeri]|uniref:Cell surface protein n=1 Tax=Methanosarcina barkeri 227 TaxID=1434106 RepID=A0A0E3R4G5_METBA|nr:glutaminyl-peptide cyclotransferase [Methanosarcina barkeri]AKB58388.1 cell surface protein [Methanosarcina barkeri 227]